MVAETPRQLQSLEQVSGKERFNGLQTGNMGTCTTGKSPEPCNREGVGRCASRFGARASVRTMRTHTSMGRPKPSGQQSNRGSTSGSGPRDALGVGPALCSLHPLGACRNGRRRPLQHDGFATVAEEADTPKPMTEAKANSTARLRLKWIQLLSLSMSLVHPQPTSRTVAQPPQGVRACACSAQRWARTMAR